MKKSSIYKAGTLRRKAEESLRKKSSKTISIPSEIGTLKLVHELEVYQIELEMQNEELLLAKEKAEESDRLKSSFLTNMSHEIRTPMNGIIGFTELLKEPDLTSDESKEYIQIIQVSGERMLHTINNIIEMAKIESGLMKPDIQEANINEKLELVYKNFKPDVESSGLHFSFKNGLSTKEAIIKTDHEKVYGILTNLINNAIKFTKDGSIEFGYYKKGKFLEFYVKDTGIGIPQKQHQIIFEWFRQGDETYTRPYEGSGLGLSICKSYAAMLGGEIWLKSDEQGSTFYFTVPYTNVIEEKQITESDIIERDKDVEILKLKTLIVEDDETSRILLTRTLTGISKEVLYADTGTEAIEICRNNPDLDLVLMDIRMPQMNGYEATRKIRQFNKDLVIIAQTAYGFESDRINALEAGCNDYISKPINNTSLHVLIEKYCHN